MKTTIIGVATLFASILGGALLFANVTSAAALAPAPVPCATAGTPFLTITQNITNDPDSGTHGDWATDAFTEKVTVWVGTDGVTYCANANTTNGTFTTTGPNSPEAGVPLSSGISGTFTGGENYLFPSSLVLNSSYSTTSPQTITLPDSSTAGFSWWVNQAFPSVASSTGSRYVQTYSLTYSTPHNGTWIDADAASGGDQGDIANVEDVTANVGYATISAAVTGANPGDTIYVGPGTYNESVNINKPLTLDGAQMGVAGASSGGVARTGSESVVTGQVNVTASDVVVNGFSFTNHGIQMNITGSAANILSGVKIENNIFSNYSSVGMPTDDAGNLLISGNYFTTNTSNSESMQIKSDKTTGGCNGTTVQDNAFVHAGNMNGADVNFSCTDSSSSNVTVAGNTDTGNSNGQSFTAFSGVIDGISVTNNTVSTSGSSIFFFGDVSGAVTISGNHITDGGSSAISIHGGDHLGTDDPSNTGTFAITGNVLSGNGHGIYVAGGAVTSGAQITAHENDFSGNTTAGVENAFESTSDTSLAVDATGNWWGNANGPTDTTQNDGSTPDTNAGNGTSAIGAVNYGGWCVNASCTPNVLTNAATGITTSDANLNGTVGPLAASQESFWISTSTFSTSDTHMPANVYSTPVLGGLGGGATFSDPLSIVTTNGIIYDSNSSSNEPVNMPTITSGTTYHYVAWANVNGTWYPGAEQIFTTVPAAPTLETPANGTILETNDFNFTWNPVTSDVSPVTYQFHSSLSPASTNGVLTTGLWTSGTLTSPQIHSTGAPDGTWYWQVRAQDANGTWSAWSPIWNMTIDTAAVTTNAANPVGTSDATLNGTNGPTAADNTSFWWGTSNAGPFTPGANPGSSELPAGWQHDSGLGTAAAGASFKEPLTGLTAGTTYYFVAWSDIGGTWHPGAVESFVTGGTTPVPSATTDAANPIDTTDATLNGTNGAVAADNTSFWWGTSNAGPFTPGANPGSSELPAGWQHDSGLAAAPANAPFSESLPGLMVGTTYYFTAWSHVGGTWYPGAVRSFATQLESPVITSPIDGSATTTAALQQVTWTNVSGTGITYVYQSATDSTTNGDGSFTNPAYTSSAHNTAYTTTSGTPAGTYYLHVMAQDSAGHSSAWSSVVKVKVVASSADLTGSLVIVKKTTNSAAASFSFNVDSAASATTTVEVSTDATGVGTSTVLDLAPGTYSVSEAASNGWTFKGAVCDSGSPSSITDGESLTIETGVTTTCTFTDEPQVSTTEVVYRGDLATSTDDVLAHPSKWFLYNDDTDQIDNSFGSFVTGPNPAPLGSGSVQFTLGNTPDDRQNIATYQFAGEPLNEITALSYSAYSHSGIGSASESPFFNFNVDFDASNAWQGRLVYVPSENGSVPQNTWNTFDMLKGGSALWSWSHFASNGDKWPDGNTNEYRTWSDIVHSFPKASVLASDGWLGVRVGEPGPTGYIGNVDNVVVTIDNGSQATTTVTDFEPDVSTETSITNVSPEPSIVNQPYTVSWSVVPDSGSAKPTGTVTVTANGGAGCSAAASAGSCEITPTSVGTVTLVATFSGDPGFDSSNSSAITVTHEVSSTPIVTSRVVGGGNGPSFGSLGFANGQVLGASTSTVSNNGSSSGSACSVLITSYLGQGHRNDPAQVKALQTFLNDQDGVGLPVTGLFGSLTASAVSQFQLKYWQDVLAPWVSYGLPTDHTPTGFVGKTTEWKINMLYCPTLDLPAPQVP